MMNRVDSDDVPGQKFNICHLRQFSGDFCDKKTAPQNWDAIIDYIMYSESLSSPICHSQSILIKETPAADNSIIQTKERSVYWHKYKRKWCHSKWHDYYIVHFCICQPFFWKFLIFFAEKGNLKFIRLPFCF